MRTKYSNHLTKYPSMYESASVSGSAAYIRAEMGVGPFVHVKVVFIKLMRLEVTYFKNPYCSYILETSQPY